MKNVVGMDDSAPTGNYLRLPVWKKDSAGKPILNVRKSVGTGGEYSLKTSLYKTNRTTSYKTRARLCSQGPR